MAGNVCYSRGGVRLQLFITCFLFAVTSTAAPPKGAWTGTLGKQKVAACFDGSDATYYYVSKGVDIALTEGADGIWTEVAWDKDFSPGPSTGTWQLEEAQGKYLRGSWSSSDGRRTLPITLKLAGKPAADSKCPLPGYVAPRIDAVQRTPSKETSVSGLRLRMFKALHGAVVGLELLDDAAALSPVKQALEAHNREMLEGYFECLSLPANHSSYSALLELALASEHWLVLVESESHDCGGPYPDWGIRAWTIDRASGKLVDIAKWLNSPLVQIARKYFRWTRPDYASAEDCAEAINKYEEFSVWPTAKGLVFNLRLPHAIAVCGQPYVVPYAKLKRHLTPAGKAAIDEISRSVARR